MIRLRQICLVAHDRDRVVQDLTRVFGIRVAFEDPAVGAFGLHNAVLPVGDQFLEVVSPVREGTAAGRHLDRRGGDGGYMLIFQTDDQDAVRTRARDAGVRTVLDSTMDGYTCLQFHPADTGVTFLEIDRQEPAEDWHPAGSNWRDAVDTGLVTSLLQADCGCTDPQASSTLWGRLMDLPVTIGRNCGMHKVRPEGFCVRFVPAGARGEGIDTVEIGVTDAAEIMRRATGLGLPVGDGAVTVGGVRFVLKG